MRVVLRGVNLAAKAALIGLLLYAVARPELPQFAGKAMDARLFTYGASTVVLPLVWLALRPSGHPHAIDLCIVLPFLMDTLGNTFDLYDEVERFDDVMHFLRGCRGSSRSGSCWPSMRRRSRAGRCSGWCSASARSRTSLGAGRVPHLHPRRAEEATAYTDTLGDLTLSLTGSLVGALLCVTVLRGAGPATPKRRSAPAPAAVRRRESGLHVYEVVVSAGGVPEGAA